MEAVKLYESGLTLIEVGCSSVSVRTRYAELRLIAALASITEAVLAADSARGARAAEQETARLQLLEQCLAQRKNDVYQEQIDLLGQMLAPVVEG